MNRNILLTALLLLGSMATGAQGQLTAQFILEWGSFGAGDSQFNEPYAVAVDSAGDVYVSDTVNHRIQKFDPNGNLLAKWGSFGTASSQFKDPVGLTVDIDGNIWVAEYSGDRVQKFDAETHFLYKWGRRGSLPGQFRIADAVCIDPDGHAFVVDKMNHRVQEFLNDSTYVRLWGGLGTDPGTFTFPVGIDCDAGGNLYVAEQGNHRIQKFDNDGNFIIQWGGLGTAPGQFNEPVHLDVGADGLVYVPDSKNHRIQVFDADGNFIIQWGASGTGPGEFDEPEGVASDGHGNIYVADTHNHRIQKFRIVSECTPCPPLPGVDMAQLTFGEPVLLAPDLFDLPLRVDTGANITFSQMTVEYDDDCLGFVSAAVGSDVTGPGSIFVNAGPGATDPTLDSHVLVNVTGNYGSGCGNEVFVLRFQYLGAPAGPCRIAWDRASPAGSPPNHLNTDGSVQIRLPALTFCDLDSLDLRTTFRFGTSGFAAGHIAVPLLVTTAWPVNFSQMTVEYPSGCLVLQGVEVGSGVVGPGVPFLNDLPGATDPLFDRHVLVNVTGEYGPGIDVEVFRLLFDFAPGATPPCSLGWDETPLPGNPPNHLLLPLPDQIPPQLIRFIDGQVDALCPSVIISGAVRYTENGTPILPGVPSPGNTAVAVEDYANPAHQDPAHDGTYSLDFGSGPLTQICLCAERPKSSCNDAEGGVISGNDLIMLQDFVAQIGLPPTPRQLQRADLNGDGFLLGNDELGLKQWIGKAAVCSEDRCLGLPNDNCAGTWRFCFPTGTGPDSFLVGMRCLADLCTGETIDLEGALLGDVDASWPNIFPVGAAAKPAPVPLVFEQAGWEGQALTLELRAGLRPGDALHHVIFSLEFDSRAFAFEAVDLGGGVGDWGSFVNSASPGVVHGILHRLAGREPLGAAGAVARFRFRALALGASSQFRFIRLLANDIAVPDAGLLVGDPSAPAPEALTRYRLRVFPNPFNPATRVGLTIPAGAGRVGVLVQVFDIAGRVVRTLGAGQREAGVFEFEWNGTDDQGHALGAGVYFVRAQAGSWMEVQRVALVR